MARKRKNSADAWKQAESDILAKLDIAAEYEALGVQIVSEDPNKDGWLSCYAIGREDQNPSAAINTNTGRYLDSGSDGLSLALWNFAAQFGNLGTWQDARKHFAEKTGIKLPSEDPPKDPAAHLVWQPWNDRLVSLWCRHKPGVTSESIKAAGGRIARYYDQFTVIAIPILGAALTAEDPVGWVLWNITGADLPIYHGKGKLVTHAKMKTTGGGEAGLIGLDALKRISDLPENGIIWFVEGPTDLLALWAAIPENRRNTHLIITNAGGSMQKPLNWMVPFFAGHRVAVIRDADTAGEEGGKRWSEWIATIAAETRWAKLPYPVESKHGKDLRDYFVDGHSYDDLLDIADQAEPITVTELAKQPTANRLDNSQPTSDNSQRHVEATPGAIEAEDDPHRLARINLERYATRTDGRTLAYWREEWYQWKDNAYRRISERELRAKLTASIKEEFDRLNVERQNALSSSNQDTDEPVTSKKVTMALVSNVMQATSSMVCIAGDTEQNTWLPTRQQKHYISMANGIVDIDALLADKDDCLLPNSPQWFSQISLPYKFDPEATCPKWQAYLEYNLAGDRALIAVAQEWAGYLLLPTTDEQVFMILEGGGKNGKSVFIAGLTAMLGVENVSNVPLELLHDKFQLYNTVGKLLNAAGDCGDLDKTAEGTLKSFVSGDRMFFDRKGISGINCDPTARLMIAANNRPRFTDRTDGIWRRMKVIPFTVTVSNEKRVKGMDKVRWWQQSGELPGIFRWALIGLARLRRQGGFTESETMKEAIEEYQEEMNPAKSFLQQFMEPTEDGAVRCAEAYRLYKKWSEENGYRPLSEKPFGKEVKRIFQNAVRARRGSRADRFWAYEGVRFSQDEIFGEKTYDATLF